MLSDLPGLGPDGRVGGLRRDLSSASVLFGRARSFGGFGRSPSAGDRRAPSGRRRRAASTQRRPACVEIGWQRRCSRAQALLTEVVRTI
ncbi:MAG: hypothetical protein IPO67_16570 [Deltaproteobacteria bacterium]|nr:hypothetical protein [Deltaproteobacteria bacterium]